MARQTIRMTPNADDNLFSHSEISANHEENNFTWYNGKTALRFLLCEKRLRISSSVLRIRQSSGDTDGSGAFGPSGTGTVRRRREWQSLRGWPRVRSYCQKNEQLVPFKLHSVRLCRPQIITDGGLPPK